MDLALSRRVANAFLIGSPTDQERNRLLVACQRADTFSDLSKHDRELIEALENQRATVAAGIDPQVVDPDVEDDDELDDEAQTDAVEGEAFHYPGKHNQKSHGGGAPKITRGRGSAPRRGRGDRAHYERDGLEGAIVAATEPEQQPTGMIALLPEAAHADRLAVPGGEPADELHSTVCYLGEINMFPEGTLDGLRRAVETFASASAPFGAHGFAIATFNPGPDGCVVLNVGGEMVANCQSGLYAMLAAFGTAGITVNLPEQPQPHIPHVTLIYDPDAQTDPRDLYDRVGPVVFDRIRIAWGDENIDIPLGQPPVQVSTPVDMPVEEVDEYDDVTGGELDAGDELAEVAAMDTSGMVPWTGIIAMEGVWTGDGRMWAPNSLYWDGVLPQALKSQPAEADGHMGSYVVGRVDEIWRDGAAIRGRGLFDAQTHPDLFRQWTNQMVRTVSIKADNTNPADIEEIPYTAPDPAGMGAAVQVDQATDVEFVEVAADQPMRYVFHRGRIRSVTLAPETAFAECVVDLLPTDVVDAEVMPADAEVVVAAGYTITIPDLPPEAWFTEPAELPPVGAVHITPEGRIFGLIAPANVAHRGFARMGQRVTARRGADYSGFMNKACLVSGEDGQAYRINAGNITFDCGHLNPYDERRANPAYATQHYDNSCSIFARVRCGENAHGTWFSGALVHGISAEQVERAMGCALSGDWQGNSFNAALLVPVEGYPTAQMASVRVQDGALVAATSPVTMMAESGRTLTSMQRIEMRAAALGHGSQDRLARLAERRKALAP